jgi:hypothetical protein|tara:strand:+ start:341 stop:490 length:150 start_codon:yes stop_codon:yes gene_type:complete
MTKLKVKNKIARLVKKSIIYLAFMSSIVSAGCLIYVVQWLEALRKGWLV